MTPDPQGGNPLPPFFLSPDLSLLRSNSQVGPLGDDLGSGCNERNGALLRRYSPKSLFTITKLNFVTV